MSRPAALEFDNITKEYRGFFKSESVKALDGFSLRVEQGEIFGFLGPNGAGKTTAIHIALGLLHSTKGKGSVLGHPFGHAVTRRRVGFLAENIALYHRPAARLVRFYGALNGMKGSDLRRRTREIFAELNLQSAAERNTARLSRGMLQRVGLAQALVNNPDLLILDEPTSALDPLGRIAVRDILKRFRQEGKTVFLSSHMLSEAEQICDRLAIVVHGRVKRVGSIPELLESQERFVITATGIDALMFPGSQQNGHIKITVPALEQRRMIEQIWLAGGEVIAVNPVRRTLEDLFVELAHQNGGGKQKDKGAS
jgi:ABC-2 type transport system ATP-binding protein